MQTRNIILRLHILVPDVYFDNVDRKPFARINLAITQSIYI